FGDVRLTESGWQAVQQQRLDDGDVRGLAESLRELVGVASDCPVAEIEGTPDVISGIARLALEVASLIDEYTRSCFMMRLGKAQVTDIRERIKQCQVKLKDLYKPLGMRIIVYTAKGAKEMKEQKLWDQIQKWLKPHDSSTNHNSARNVCAKGTGAWLAKDEQFQKWLNEPGRTLWISGRREYSPACAVRTVLRFIHEAGFGKTVLFSTCVENVREHESTAGSTCYWACFYFDGREFGGASRKFETLLRSILNQLYCKQTDIPDAIKRLYGVNGKEHPQPTLAQLKTTLGEVVKDFDEVYILIDAPSTFCGGDGLRLFPLLCHEMT
ncbi:hypothetical protein PAXINDRAFT_19552, partial [Paxillus involutus ATCC 200175]